ncbi:MAG: hypothetical protein EAZ95_15595 [Bacteroidetes bacterium]|nr:MAG: hypothetical protein EAZ95_15595 [Bacteroidota bacterium]
MHSQKKSPILTAMRWFPILLFLAVSSALSGCRVYNQNILFQTKENIINNQDTIASKLQRAEKNYVIQAHDYIEIRLFTANGEALLNPMLPQDPNNSNQANGQNGRKDKARVLLLVVEILFLWRCPFFKCAKTV